MLSDEEKQAIEYLKIEYEKLMKEDNILFPLYKSDAKRLIDIIEKQQKEIEELKTTKKELTERVLRLESDKFWENVVSKDKIKAKIEEANKIIDEDKDFINKFQNSVDANAINWYYQKVDLNVRIRNILESLLEKE